MGTNYWMKDSRVKAWLTPLNSKLLYFVSVAGGSSFVAIKLFNSRLFAVDIFDMGLSQTHITAFETKKLHSIVIFENIPQLALSVWYTVALGRMDYIPAAQMTLSLISIIVVAMTMVLQTRIDEIQDCIVVSFDVCGDCVTDNLSICKNRISKIKTFLWQTVLNIPSKFIDIQRPHAGYAKNGLRIKIFITRIRGGDIDTDKSVDDLMDDYVNAIQAHIDNKQLNKVIVEEWELEISPSQSASGFFVGNVRRQYFDTKTALMELSPSMRQVGSASPSPQPPIAGQTCTGMPSVEMPATDSKQKLAIDSTNQIKF